MYTHWHYFLFSMIYIHRLTPLKSSFKDIFHKKRAQVFVIFVVHIVQKYTNDVNCEIPNMNFIFLHILF